MLSPLNHHSLLLLLPLLQRLSISISSGNISNASNLSAILLNLLFITRRCGLDRGWSIEVNVGTQCKHKHFVYRFQALKNNGTLLDVTRSIDCYWKSNNKVLIWANWNMIRCRLFETKPIANVFCLQAGIFEIPK